MRLAFFPLTDLGNAERFRERQRGRLLFNTALATTSPGRQRGWLAWDGRRWSSESGAERVMIAEHETVRSIQEEAECVAESGDRDEDGAEDGARDFVVETKKDGTKTLYSDKIARWGRSSESAQKLGALSKRGAPYLSVGIGHLDADRMKINVNNGTLVIRKRDDGDYVQFAPHDPADMITKVSPVDYDPSARHRSSKSSWRGCSQISRCGCSCSSGLAYRSPATRLRTSWLSLRQGSQRQIRPGERRLARRWRLCTERPDRDVSRCRARSRRRSGDTRSGEIARHSIAARVRA
jgi:hypothetical protein